jgi:exonuclease SbcC
MRLHHLEVTAFGPFPERVEVDFDQLSDAGLFLLSGPTGAGKTSVLDAVCFALYGDVPGDRSAARRLRCDQARAGVAPRVQLEATLSGRRFRIVRSPAWERPKKRGTGVTTEQASVVISERVGGEWITHSTRLDETGHLVTGLVGMNLTQFTQVAMLPQGRFQAFLRARSEERHQLLQRLFRTGRFEDVERWLRERRLTLRRQSETCHQAVADLVSRISEVTDQELPEGWDIRDLTPVATEDDLLVWAEALGESASAESRDAEAAVAQAARAESEAHEALEAARALVQRRARLDAAAAEHARLTRVAAEVEADRRALDAARCAAPVVPLDRMVCSARGTRDRARTEADEATAAAAGALGLLMVDRATLVEAAARAGEEAAAARAALPRQTRLEAAVAHRSELEERRVPLLARLAEAREQQRALPDRVDTLRGAVAAAEAARAELPAVRYRLDELAARVAAHADVTSLTAALAVARADWLAVRETALDRHERLLELRQARVDGMAAEIAGALAAGACCPVCGSADHPSKARPAPGAPDADTEKAAQRALDDAKAEEHAHDVRVRDLTTQLATATGRAGAATPEETGAERAGLATRLAELGDTAGRLESLTGELAAAEAARERLADEIRRDELDAAALDLRVEQLREEADQLRQEVDRLLAGTGCGSLAVLVEEHVARAAAGQRGVRCLDALAVAETGLAEVTLARDAAVAEAGFDLADDAVAAALSATETDALAARLAEHDRRLAAVTAVLREPGADELALHPLPELPALSSARSDALAALGDARAAAARWASRRDRLTGLRGRLGTAVEEWRPVLGALSLTTRLSSFVEGKSADNRMQMRLSAYVLAYRLSQVVAAANERLAGMSDRRYSLEHTGRRGAGETRGGLSLLVRDDWSGEARDPATLSGGETFVVSLALALGLADVITQEAGGADLDTLFVDEGFGSLDADTLDDVMDTLDSLRDGGRVVGVVSHVAEMRDRIPTQLRVAKSRQGSTVSVSR